MPTDLRLDREKGILVVTVRGPLTLEEFRATLEEITHSDQYPPDIATLWDFREMEFQATDSDFFRSIISIRKHYPERGAARAAHIVAGDLAFGMLRMHEILSDADRVGLPQLMKVFKSFSEGEQWLLDGSA